MNCTHHKGRQRGADHHTKGPATAQGLPAGHRRAAGSRPRVGSPWSQLSSSPCLEWPGKSEWYRSSHLGDTLPVCRTTVGFRQRGNWISDWFLMKKRLPQDTNSFHDKSLVHQAPQQLVKPVSCEDHLHATLPSSWASGQHQEGKVISSSETWWLGPDDTKSQDLNPFLSQFDPLRHPLAWVSMPASELEFCLLRAGGSGTLNFQEVPTPPRDTHACEYGHRAQEYRCLGILTGLYAE